MCGTLPVIHPFPAYGSLGWTWGGGNLRGQFILSTNISTCSQALKLGEHNGGLRHEQDTMRGPERGFIMNWMTQRASPGMKHLSFLEGCPECLKIKSIIGRENYPSKGMQVGRHGDTCRKKRGIGKRWWWGEMAAFALLSHSPS